LVIRPPGLKNAVNSHRALEGVYVAVCVTNWLAPMLPIVGKGFGFLQEPFGTGTVSEYCGMSYGLEHAVAAVTVPALHLIARHAVDLDFDNTEVAY
jgi:hypothetical protein